MAVGQEQHQTISALAISVFDYLLRATIDDHDLGRRSRQQTAGILDAALVVRPPHCCDSPLSVMGYATSFLSSCKRIIPHGK